MSDLILVEAKSNKIIKGEEIVPLSSITPQAKQILVGDECMQFENCLIKHSSCNNLSENLKLENPYDGVYYIDHALTEEECEALRKEIDSSDSLSFWCAGKEHDSNVRSYRNANTIEMQSNSFAERIWQRVKRYFEDIIVSIEDDPDHEEYERDLIGKWYPIGLNPYSLFAKYPSFGSFAPHTDGRAIIDFNHRSHYSVIVYLNSVPKEEGAGTKFYRKSAIEQLKKVVVNGEDHWTADRELLTFEAEAKAGRFLVFHQSLVHEGVPPSSPHFKYIIRSDIIFERRPVLCDSTTDREAYQLFRKAEDLAESGEVEAAVPLFKRAFKLSPTLAQLMGQA